MKTNSKRLSKTKGSKRKHMIQGLLSILDGVIRIGSFGAYWSNFEYTYVIKKLGQK